MLRKFVRFAPNKTVRFLSFGVLMLLIVVGKFNTYLQYEPSANATSDMFEVAAPIKKESELLEVLVSRVVDGDTFVGDNNERYRIAYMDAPEKDQQYGIESSDFLTALIEGENCEVNILYKDKYGRNVVNAFVNKVDIAKLMVEYGYAWDESKKYKSDLKYSKELNRLQNKAMFEKAGMWSSDNNEKPSEYRASKKSHD